MDSSNTAPPPVHGPPSVERVLAALRERGPLTMKDLQSASGLARRTVYGAIHRLRDLGIIAEQVCLRDARQTWYWIST